MSLSLCDALWKFASISFGANFFYEMIDIKPGSIAPRKLKYWSPYTTPWYKIISNAPHKKINSAFYWKWILNRIKCCSPLGTNDSQFYSIETAQNHTFQFQILLWLVHFRFLRCSHPGTSKITCITFMGMPTELVSCVCIST